MYRQDYSLDNLTPTTKSARLYDANYYVMNSEFKVYTCIENGSSGINTTGNASLDEPTLLTWDHLRQVLVVMDMFGNTFSRFLQAILSNLILRIYFITI